VLDTGTRQLMRAGREVPLGPKAFELLESLLRARPKVLSRTRLRTALWPDTHVGPTSLHVLISQVRAALGDEPDEPRFVRTVHRFGYAFLAGAIEEGAEQWQADVPRREPRVTHPRLVFRGRDYLLRDGENVVGRDEGSAVRIEGAGVSRHHARLLVDRDRVTIEDLGSKNGTHVQGERLVELRQLSDGDTISFGSRAEVVFHLFGEPETESES